MKILGERLRALRTSMQFSQLKIANLIDSTQASVNRYEMGKITPPVEILLWYANYFDVSLDYIFGRTDKPQGQLYECKPTIETENKEIQKFVEMCFDPNSSINERLKQKLIEMLSERGGIE